jgi:hypothetical protein
MSFARPKTTSAGKSLIGNDWPSLDLIHYTGEVCYQISVKNSEKPTLGGYQTSLLTISGLKIWKNGDLLIGSKL